MLTSVSPSPVLNTPLLIALVTLKGYQEWEKRKKAIYVEDLAEYLVQLKTNGVNISSINISGSPGEYWSEDIAEFVSEGIVFGYLTHRSPIEFAPRCRSVCTNAIKGYTTEDEEIKPELKKAAQILELDDFPLPE